MARGLSSRILARDRWEADRELERTLMLKLALFSLCLAACATGGLHVDLDAATPAHTRLDLASTPATVQITPRPLDPSLPSVDRIASRIRHELGPVATADLKLCVRPSGKIASVELVGGSALPAFDLAVVKDASMWQFAAMPGPESLQSCRLATVVYRPHS
jgi:hypothetical protein